MSSVPSCGPRLAFFAAGLVLLGALRGPHAHAQVDYLYGSGFETDAVVQLAAVRAAPDGAASLPVGRAIVTYVKPLVGNDPAGFFVQGGPVGPAIFVRIDPTTLSPLPQPGDEVSFTVTTLASAQGRREVTALSGYSRSASGRPLAPLTQSVAMTGDLVSNLSAYESELISISGLLATAPVGAGSGFLSTRLDTPAISGNASLVLRAPATLFDEADLVASCSLTAQRVPMWRFNANAQVSPFAMADIAGLDCPAVRVLAAFPVAGNVVRVVFDRRILPASVLADGSQFTFSGGLLATGASVSGRQVDVQTSAQLASVPYAVTVAGSVQDLTGKPIAAGFTTASFAGFVGAAGVEISEVNGNINGNRDLIEIRALTGGSVAGIELVQDPAAGGAGTLLAVLPPIIVGAGDRIVVHFAPVGETDETVSQGQCVDPACYASAWDVRGSAAGILYSNRIIALRRPVSQALIDVIAVGRSDLANPTTAFPANLQFVQAAGQWLPANCGGVACTYSSTPSALAVSADWTGLGTGPTGTSLQRSGVDSNQRSDWVLAPASFGLPNP